MRLVGALLEPPLRQLDAEECAADPQGHELYLRIMGAAFGALDQMTQDMTLEDLRKLSRIVAEQRRADGMARRSGGAGTARAKKPKPATSPGGGAPPLAQQPAFVEMVRQIYGLDLLSAPTPEHTAKPSPVDPEP